MNDAKPLHVIFDRPVIPPNTGNAIRMCAGSGAHLHLAGPLIFKFDDKHLRRAGLDYHDLADVHQHQDISAALDAVMDPAIGSGRVFAFTSSGKRWHTDVDYQPGDALLFGPEPTGLEQAVLEDPRVTELIRIPMLPGRRSMNLSNAAAVAVYEAWRQLGFQGAV
ncbi:MAG TPA: tRNA (cytidine(34)-2'-O)-methyltransferase [Candidatus Corynebacterium gallistercoris]|uniref:Putative tRNA (cytidine(34)-2'-O)-methyltransferase n=1 Tax=Candidatus Corynebacterium gallistercoris TaxID=2838530 RepID=A0A9D1RXK9_9CORY|nr:tRNA (cytidine(34)-2'-O)-methyltransferase [Candidatus Corynebacterium gallistercoris]